MPPFVSRALPVIKPLLSLARKRIASASSSVVPTPPTGMISFKNFLDYSVILGAIGPGDTEFTVMLCAASSLDRKSVIA